MSSLKMFYWILVISAISICNLDFVQGASPRWEPQISILCEAGQGQVYQPQFLSEEGRWITDLSVKTPVSTCLRDKMDLLDYCKKVYPNRDITNIVESSHYQKIGGWCRQGALHSSKCKGSHRWIKPFRCLEGPFQSDALLVPEGCLFDHIHNASRCWPFVRWNQTGAAACQERGMQMRSFAMLLPCGISLFSGVEFVCCPKHFKASETMRFKKTDLPVVVPEKPIIEDEDNSDDSKDNDQDEDMLNDEEDMIEDSIKSTEDAEENGEDEYDSNEDASEGESESYDQSDNWDDLTNGNNKIQPLASTSTTTTTTSSSTTSGNGNSATTPKTSEMGVIMSASSSSPPTNQQPTIDPYFTHFDPRLEHQSYKVSQKEAQQRLEENHREKVTRVMKDWSDLEEKYQDMRMADPKAAQNFKQRMTARFQALEEEGNAEKHQLAAMHQQRVLAHINQRKREAMTCYTQALTEQPPNTHRVEKCLQKLLRALHKDRAHALAHYRHLLNSGGPGGLEAAASERPRTLERLIDIDRAVNQSMTMLKRYPELSNKISQLMSDYILALRSKDDIPGSELGMSEEAEASILDKYRIEIERKVSEKERQRLAEKQRKEQRAAEREKLREEKLRMEAKKIEELVKEEAQTEDYSKKEKIVESESNLTTMESLATEKYIVKEVATEIVSSQRTQTPLPTVDDEAVQRAVEDVAAAAVAHQEIEPRMQHFMTHDLGHESSFTVHREHVHSSREGRNVYFTLSFAGVALMAAVFVGVAVAKWRTSRSPHAQGFIEVDQTAAGVPVTPEEKHVVNMQINGYENPTYKYFEVKE